MPIPSPGVKQYSPFLTQTQNGQLHDSCKKKKKKSPLHDCNHCSKWKLHFSMQGERGQVTPCYTTAPKCPVEIGSEDLILSQLMSGFILNLRKTEKTASIYSIPQTRQQGHQPTGKHPPSASIWV